MEEEEPMEGTDSEEQNLMEVEGYQTHYIHSCNHILYTYICIYIYTRLV